MRHAAQCVGYGALGRPIATASTSTIKHVPAERWHIDRFAIPRHGSVTALTFEHRHGPVKPNI